MFAGLPPKEKAKASQIILQDITVYPDKLVLEILIYRGLS